MLLLRCCQRALMYFDSLSCGLALFYLKKKSSRKREKVYMKRIIKKKHFYFCNLQKHALSFYALLTRKKKSPTVNQRGLLLQLPL